MNFIKKTFLIALCLSATSQMQSGAAVQGLAGLGVAFSNVATTINIAVQGKKSGILPAHSFMLLPSVAAIAAGARADSTIFDFPLTILGASIGLAWAHDGCLKGTAYWASAYAGAAVGELINMLCQDQPDLAASAGRVAILPTLGIAGVLAGNALGVNAKY